MRVPRSPATEKERGRLLSDELPLALDTPTALAVAGLAALLGTLFVMPRAIRKLRGAGVIGRDVNKPDRPEVAEMGGIGAFLGFNLGVFVLLLVLPVPDATRATTLAALMTVAGATMTGIVDDLLELRQRFKAILPFVFAGPLMLFVSDWSVWLPGLGDVPFGWLYPLVLVPIGIACASNGFNMLEGWNGLGSGIGIILALALSIIAYASGNLAGLFILVPLAGCLLAFYVFNRYPAKAFPGDTLTLMTGCALAVGAMLSKIEFWGALLFIPHVIEFAIKGANGFPSRGWWGEYRDGKLHCPAHGPVGLGQWFMKTFGGLSEKRLVATMLVAEAAVATVVVGIALATVM